MRFLVIIFSLILFNTQSFGQWKSYYPEKKYSLNTQKKEDNENKKKKFDIHFFNAIKAKSLEDYDKALEGFAECIMIDNKNSVPFYESAMINAKSNNYIVAVEQIKKALEIDKKNKSYLLCYAEMLFKKQDFFNSAIQYKKLIALDPGNEELYFKLSEVYIYGNKFKKAIQVYDDLEKYKGVDKMFSMQKHKIYREINDINGAIYELNKILLLFPEDLQVIEILAELYLLNDDKEKAFKLFEKIAAISPNNGRIHLTLADYYRENGDNEKSYNELKLAFKSIDLNIDTKIRILASYFQLITIDKEMANQAYELSEILVKQNPENIKARVIFADILYANNKYQEAKEQYLMILEKDKSKNQIWNQILFIQAEQNDFEGMLKNSKEALEYFPLDPLFYYFNGVSNKWFENYENALHSLETGVEFVIDNSNLLLEFYSSLADIYHTQKKHKLSDEYYEKALDIDSENAMILNNYAYYLSVRKNKLEKAKEMSFKSNQIEKDNGTYQDTYAWVLYQLKEYNKARDWLLKALSNGGDESAVIIEHYGDVLYQLGEKKEAIDQWLKAKKIGEGSGFLNKKIQEEKLYE